jgi:gentisate 1,2-dioxygenase
MLDSAVEHMNLTPGWITRDAPIIAHSKSTIFKPAHWEYAAARKALDIAGDLVDVELAERRNLILRNPIPDNGWATSRTLVCAYQMILPGEFAPSHRHSCNALRVIIDGTGSYSIVNGDRMPMESGDVVLTPGNHWHGHGLDGDEPAYWLDCLDVPLGHLLETMYFNSYVEEAEPAARLVEDSPYRFSRDSIARSLDGAQPDGEGRTGAFTILATPSMPSTGLMVQRLESNEATIKRRTTANRIFSVMEGAGTTLVDGEPVTWTRGDTLVVPSGTWFAHRASTDSQLLEMSDEPLLRFANHFREELD